MARLIGNRKENPKKNAKTISYQALEQRLLLDGAAVATLVDTDLFDDSSANLLCLRVRESGPKMQLLPLMTMLHMCLSLVVWGG